MATTLRRESTLTSPPESVWDRVCTTQQFQYVCAPLLSFRSAEPPEFPERWREGEMHRVRMYALGILPLGEHTLVIERLDHERHILQTREHDALTRRWDHRISLENGGEGRTLYRDEIVIDAGPLTPIVHAIAFVLFAHRHRRWRAYTRT